MKTPLKTNGLSLLVFALAACSVDAQSLVINPGKEVVTYQAPSYQAPGGFYSPYPGIVAPVPYPNWDYPPHWIYSYMRWDSPNTGYTGTRRVDNTDDRPGQNFRGRDNLYPAVPYSEYMKDQKSPVPPPAAKPAPTADKALLEIRMPVEKARLYFDGKEAIGDGETRIFHTPALKAGQTYTFNLKAAWPGGLLDDDLSSEQTVSFRAGEHKIVDLRPKN